MDSYPILKALIDADTECQRHFKKDGGFQITDLSIKDEVYRMMDERLRDSKEQVTFSEFAAHNYGEALSFFSDYVKERSVVLYVWTPFATCLEGNRERFKRGGEDSHFVPEDLMEMLFKNDDIEQLFVRDGKIKRDFFGWDLRVFDNTLREGDEEEVKRVLELLSLH